MPNLMITATNYTSQKVQTVNVEKGKPLKVFVEEETTELKQPVCKRESILLEINSNQNSIDIINNITGGIIDFSITDNGSVKCYSNM
jgi:hypothetical protein